MPAPRKGSQHQLPKAESTNANNTSTQQRDVSETGQHIPRPPNAFLCFRSFYVKEQKNTAANPATLNQKHLSRSAAEVWNGMSQAEREPFRRMAVKNYAEVTKKYPHYKYRQPKDGAQGKTKRAAKQEGAEDKVVSTHKATRKSSKSSMVRRKSRETTSTSTSTSTSSATPTPEPVEEAKPVVPTLSTEPLSVKPIIQAKAKPTIYASPIRPASYDRVPPQFKAHIPPSVIATLTLARRTPSPAPAAYPSTAAYEIPALPARRSVSPPLPHLPSPAPISERELEWGAWGYATLEMYDNTEDMEFGALVEDLGFYHPGVWDGSETLRAFRPLNEEDEWDFSLMRMGN